MFRELFAIDPRDRMTPEEFNLALTEFQAFGPQNARPIEERWGELFPKLDPRCFAALRWNFRRLQKRADQLVQEIWRRKTTEEEAIVMLCRKHPMLSRERARYTLDQAMYFASK